MEVVVRAGALRRAAVVVLFGVALASCGARTSVLEPTLRAGDFAAAAARAVCENIGSCCTTADHPFDPTKCEATLQSRLAMQFAVPETASDTRIPAACVDHVAAAARQCRTWQPCAELEALKVDHATAGASCSGTCFAARGTLACGGGGSGTSSCFASDGLFCNSKLGVCAAGATLGQACAADDFSCTGSWCNAGVCAPYIAEGADCTKAVAGCAEGFVCESGSRFCSSLASLENLTCTCDRLRTDGAECTDDRQCATAPCLQGRCQSESLTVSDLAALCTG